MNWNIEELDMDVALDVAFLGLDVVFQALDSVCQIRCAMKWEVAR